MKSRFEGLLPLLLLLTLPAAVQAQFYFTTNNGAITIWSPVGTNTLTDGSSHFSDPQWTDYPARFYRLRSP